MSQDAAPTKRELEILAVIWRLKQATVREVYEQLRAADVPIVQNTVQAFLRTMEEKGLVTHTTQGRAFVYRAAKPRQTTGLRMVARLLNTVYDGAIDQLVDGLFSYQKPSDDELDRLEAMIVAARGKGGSSASIHRSRSKRQQPPRRAKGDSR